MSRLSSFALAAAMAAPALVGAESIITAPPPQATDAMADLIARQALTTYETTSPLPLTEYFYPFSALPEQVNPYAIGRGPQSGYNVCNSTTEGATSQCQTMVVNSLADFCLWGSPVNDGQIGNVEAAVVAYCSQPGHGTRLMAPGTITGATFMKTSAYIQITGTFEQTGINLDANDFGGELDPHGADLLGNPIGGVVYSNNLPSSSSNTSLVQSQSWNNFVGSGLFCMKVCDPTVSSPNYCENRFDLIGCTYNMPATYQKGEFLSCEGELQDVVGTYTSNGQTLTWSQPESLPATSTLPWTPRVPASSNCQTFSSQELFGSLTGSGVGSASGTATASGSAKTTAKASATGSSVKSGSGTGSAGPAATGASSAAGRNVAAPAVAAVFALVGVVATML